MPKAHAREVGGTYRINKSGGHKYTLLWHRERGFYATVFYPPDQVPPNGVACENVYPNPNTWSIAKCVAFIRSWCVGAKEPVLEVTNGQRKFARYLQNPLLF